MGDELIKDAEHRAAGADLAGVDVAVAPEAGFVFGGAGAAVGDGGAPDVAALVALANALYGDVVRVGGHELVEEVGDFLVLEVAVVGDRHSGHGAEITAEVACFTQQRTQPG